MGHEGAIVRAALKSRFFLVLLQYASNQLIPDHAAEAFIYPTPSHAGILEKIVIHLFGGFLRWDAQHFMHIARFGYTYEQSLAFFPFYPLLVRFLAIQISWIIPFLALDSIIILLFLTVNVLCFTLSALTLYELSRFVGDSNFSKRVSLLFCFNPASIFFIAPYTETIFSYLTFKSMLNCLRLYNKYCDIPHLQVKDFVYIMPICLSTSVRSNGVLNIGFLLYILICISIKRRAIKFAIIAIFLGIFCTIPFILFQIYAYQTFCTNFEIVDLPISVLEYGKLNDFVLAGSFSQHNQSWCFRTIPIAYSYIQSHYWKVGFLKYFQLKQIPNFILASPIIIIILMDSLTYLQIFFLRLTKLFDLTLTRGKCRGTPIFSIFVIHAVFLVIFSIFTIHVQVTTRMLCSASPIVYWFAADRISDDSLKKYLNRRCSLSEYFILSYFLSYFVIGTIMFCNFLPWT